MVSKEKPFQLLKEKPQLQEICECRPNNKNMSVLSAVEHSPPPQKNDSICKMNAV